MDYGRTELDKLPLTIAWVPMQSNIKAYPPEEALLRGTLFPDLDKPFIGKKMKEW